MSAHTGFGPRDRWRLRQNRLWILAAFLAAATVYSAAGIIHDVKPRRVAANLVRKATAERIASFAESKLTTLALETFVPATSIGALTAHQAAAARCACRDTLPATEFFRLDLRTNTLDRTGRDGPSDVALASVARAAAAERTKTRIRLSTSRELGASAVVTYVELDSTGKQRAVLGLVAAATDLGALLFQNAARSTAIVEQGDPMATLDSMAVLAFGADSVRLFGTPDPEGRYYTPTPLHGSLEGNTIGIALPSWRINPALIQLASPQQLWHNGLLFLATVIVVIFAVGSSRREMLLARSRSDFVAGVSHDLRMPLAQILLASETLVAHGNATKSEREGLASTIVRESRRLIGLVENLLLFSRTGSVELRPRLETVRVDDLFFSVVESVELAADDAQQVIDVSPAPSLGVLADAQLLHQAIVNLVDNALKYGSPGQRVHLAANRVSTGAVRLVVDDEGPGIPAEERERVFEPYQRLDRDQTSERTGTGLGLSVVRQIIVACSGRVWIEDAPTGRGTRVVIELGAVEMSAPTPAAAETT